MLSSDRSPASKGLRRAVVQMTGPVGCLGRHLISSLAGRLVPLSGRCQGCGGGTVYGATGLFGGRRDSRGVGDRCGVMEFVGAEPSRRQQGWCVISGLVAQGAGLLRSPGGPGSYRHLPQGAALLHWPGGAGFCNHSRTGAALLQGSCCRSRALSAKSSER